MPAFLLKPLAGWLAAGIAIIVLGAICYGLWSSLEGKDAQIAAEKDRTASATERANAMAVSVTQHQQAIEQLKSAYLLQTEKVKEGRAREDALSLSVSAAALKNRDLRGKAALLARDLAAEAEKRPGDVRAVGPIVAERAPKLFE